MMRSVWRIIPSPEDAEDAFQEALATIWMRLKRIRRHPNPHALILKICLDAARDALRRKVRRHRLENRGAIVEAIPDHSSRSPDSLIQKEQQAMVFHAIGQLPRKQAEAILMLTVQERGYTEIAQALGCSEATARTHVRRARARLRKRLSHVVGGLCAEAGL